MMIILDVHEPDSYGYFICK